MPSARMGGCQAHKHSRNRGLLLVALSLSLLLWVLDKQGGTPKMYQHAAAVWAAPAELVALRADIEKMRGPR